MTLTDKVVLITGASSGIGDATARLLVERGAYVVLGARRVDRLEALVRELGDDRAVAATTDVTQPEDVLRLVALADSRFGRLDAVFANAGFGGGGTVAAGDPEHWRRMLMTNVYGLALTAHYAVPPMLASGGGHVVFMSSVAGRHVPTDRNHMYAASKFAVEALGEGLRKELTGRVRVTLIAPGMVDTEFGDWPEGALTADDIARSVVFALEQPDGVAINHMLIRPSVQEF